MRYIAFVPACAALLTALPAAAEMETFSVDPLHTLPTYEISHFGYSMQRGRFNRTSGKITFDSAARKGSADIVIEAASVDSGVPKLDEHLRSEDFFDVAKYPRITFKSSDFSFDGDKLKSATGALTMHGVTRPITLNATVFQCAANPVSKRKQCGADFVATLKRSDFGINAYLPALGDEVTLRIPVESVKEP